MSNQPEIALIGVGNVLLKDEGVGVFAARYLASNYSFEPAVEIIDGGTLGFKLMGYFQEYKRVIILDTVSVEDEVGTLYRLPSDILMGMGSCRKTAHEVEVLEMLEICSLLEKMAEVVIIGVVPKDIKTVQIGLTDPIEQIFEAYVAQVVREIESYGVIVTPLEHKVTLEEMVRGFMGVYNEGMAEKEGAWSCLRMS